jgi:predicted flap endonuclease-1-like 5' DNA nuclease
LSVAGLLALLVWWWLRRCSEEEVILETEAGTISRARHIKHLRPTPETQAQVSPAETPAPTEPTMQVEVSEAEAPAPPEPAEPDDLRRIEGIGPKISDVLQDAGITTFAQLAATETDRLGEILSEGGIRIANPGTWPEQARLAAAGDWDGLKKLQGQLKGGRRV